MPFEFQRLEIKDVVIIKPLIFEDKRGYFMETYKKSEFENIGIKTEFIQENHSRSKNNVLRGLHFQLNPYAQAKLVRCIKGSIYDVVVDLRKNSPTFGKWIGVVLSEENKYQLYIPRGFAHGFLVLSNEAEVIYKVDNLYAPQYEAGIIWNDNYLNINWPIKDPIISEKDKKWPSFEEAIKRGWYF